MKQDTAYLYSPGGYLLEENGNIVRDKDGRPVKTAPKPDIPFTLRSWQPFGSHQANNRFGLNAVEVNFRFFSNPDDRLTLNTEMLYKNSKYKITWVFPYNSHFEVLVKLLP
ncbi:hypothetical protein [Bacillus infantis]|uniref:hypothetical protein n=1 Tax=Bacillus infantis TaxID=324767 RepID=UPI003CF749AE